MELFPVDQHVLLTAMKETSTLNLFEDLILIHFRQKLQNEIIPKFCVDLKKGELLSVFIAVKNLHESVCWFYDYVAQHHDAEDIKLSINNILNACLKWKVDNSMLAVFKTAFSFSLQFFLNEDYENFDENNDLTLVFRNTKTEMKFLDFQNIHQKYFVPMVKSWLVDLGLGKIFRDEIVISILKTEIDRFVTKNCSKQFERSWIGDGDNVLGTWAKSRVFPWLQMVFHTQFKESEWEEKLLYVLYNSYTKLRISEMLSIITDYPDSTPVLQDLKLCLQHTRQRPALIKSLKNDIANRVLHPGVSTQSIISVYISAVKALRELDISGVVMEMVLESCTEYLTQREDSVRMIMQGLLWDDGSNDLAAELTSNLKEDSPLTNELVTSKPEEWNPDPREADPRKLDKSKRTSDIVTLFIGMYGSKEKFIKEYQKLLSKRLLQTWCSSKHEATEIRNLELLKKRFGEDDMSKCAVMMKDVTDSRRINANIKEEKESTKIDFDLQTLIVSGEFWPEIPNLDFRMPRDFDSVFEDFKKGFERLKVSRSLTWLNSVGLVDMELEVGNRTVAVKATTLQAAIIWHFQDKNKWTLTELGDELKIPPTPLCRKMAFWLQQGIIKQVDSETYELVTESCSKSSERIHVESFEEEEEEGDENDNEESKEKHEQILWNYIQGMLKNLEALALDRIYKMLQMFVMHDANVQLDTANLRDLLNRKVQKGALLYEQGKYKLVRDAS